MKVFWKFLLTMSLPARYFIQGEVKIPQDSRGQLLMHRKPADILFLIVCLGTALGSSQAAQGGFIKVAIEPGATIPGFSWAVSGGASVPDNSVPPPAPFEIEHPGNWLVALLEAPGSTGGMSSSGSAGSSSAPPAALPPPSSVPPTLGLRRLLAWEECFHPKFIKSRLFRPPRS